MIELYVAIIVLIICLYFKWQLSYWTRKKITGPAPYPIFGNMLDYVLMRKHFGEVYDDIYKSYPNANYVGFYKMGNPAILVRNLDLVKDVLVRDFSSFHDNDFIVDEKLDPLLAESPFVATGSEWKTRRAQIAPIFTAAKMKGAFPIIKGVCDKMTEYIDCGPESNHPDGFEAKTLTSKYTIDVVASCAFGVEGESFTNPDSAFHRNGMKIFVPSTLAMIRTFVALFVPSLIKVVPLPFIPKEVDQWLRSIVRQIIKRRQETNERRNDFLQTILDMKETDHEIVIDENFIVGHALTFLTEGFETSSTLMTYTLYELAVNQDLQKRIQQEIDEMLTKHDNQLTDEGIQELSYLDQFMNEVLRYHSPVFAMTKICTKQYKLPSQYSDSKQGIFVEIGTPIVIPVFSIHHDPHYYENPKIFNPDNFSEENRKTNNKYSFLSFGEGPRICLGMKFGVLQSKAGIISILTKYNVKISEKSIVPPPISKKAFLMACEEGIWVKFEKRL